MISWFCEIIMTFLSIFACHSGAGMFSVVILEPTCIEASQIIVKNNMVAYNWWFVFLFSSPQKIIVCYHETNHTALSILVVDLVNFFLQLQTCSEIRGLFSQTATISVRINKLTWFVVQFTSILEDVFGFVFPKQIVWKRQSMNKQFSSWNSD